ncbi:MAG: hypothetical protein V3T58_06875 [Candidatus Hydrothermarchaeales archaeon]
MVFSISCDNGTLKMFDKVERKVVRFGVEGWEFTDKSYWFRFPVDETFSGRCKKVEYDTHLTYIRRKEDYELLVHVRNGVKRSLPKDKYIIEIDAHFKIYLYVYSTIRVECDKEANVSLSFDPKAQLIFGVRSYRRRPEATIRTTKDIEGIARAISLLSSSIKVASPERSYPTLRGHPPLIEFSGEPSTDIEKLESGVEIFLPMKLAYLYVASPLAYYLLADIRFGEPRITCNNGFQYPLSKLPRFEDEVNQTLQKVFFLDCLVRNAGLYKPDLYELKALKGLDLDIKELYSMSIQEQLPIYMGIPIDKLKPFMPTWHLASYVNPDMDNAKALPFLLNNLSTIYLARSRKISPRDVSKLSFNELFRGNVIREIEEKTIAKPVLKEAQSHLWLAPEKPIDVAKMNPDAVYNQLNFEHDKGRIRVALVLNDEEMLREKDTVQNIYAQRKDIPLDVEIFDFLQKDELAGIFEEGYDLVHYIGHCDERGLQCADGFLKIKEIQKNNTPAFFLNACKSYEEGMDLVSSGSVGGVVTLYYVPNEQALKIGYTFSILLTLGFPIEKAISLSKMGSLSGRDYLVLGDGNYCLMQNPRLNTVFLFEISSTKQGRFRLLEKNCGYQIGGYFYSDLDKKCYLFYNEAKSELSRSELLKLLEKTKTSVPVIYEDKLFFSEEISDIFKNKKKGG